MVGSGSGGGRDGGGAMVSTEENKVLSLSSFQPLLPLT